MFLIHIITSLIVDGLTVMALLRMSAKRRPLHCALVTDGMRINYGDMYRKARAMAGVLAHEYHITKGMRVAMMCRNHEWSVLMLAALSRLGADIMLVNTDASAGKVSELLTEGKVSMLFYDEEYAENISGTDGKTLCVQIEAGADGFISHAPSSLPFPLTLRSRITVFTGGTSGKLKAATRSNGIIQFLPPLTALIKDIRIHRYASVLIALPLYHGFGLATLAVSLFLGKKICLMRHFDAKEAVSLTDRERLEVLPVVPAMLSRMMNADDGAGRMKCVKCIISGGDRLERSLTEKVRNGIGDVLFNLYGTTEAGFFLLATPADIARNSELTIGRPIAGVQCCVRDKDDDGVGTLWVKSRWAMIGRANRWQSTGDRVFQDVRGYLFHRGRTDNMVVCGGENVYPEHVQHVLHEHPDVADALVFAVDSTAFGKVLNAHVELIPASTLTSADIRQWLKPRVSRAEMPHDIVITHIDILPTGKRRVTDCVLS